MNAEDHVGNVSVQLYIGCQVVHRMDLVLNSVFVEHMKSLSTQQATVIWISDNGKSGRLRYCDGREWNCETQYLVPA